MRLKLLLLALLLLSVHVAAQNKTRLRGTIVDKKSGEAIGFANVIVFSAGDTTQLAGTASDENGRFAIRNLAPGVYDLLILVIGYERTKIKNIELSPANPNLDLSQIELAATLVLLESVETTAERSQLQLSFDKKVFTVGKDLSATGNSAADILDNIPSVTVDMEGNVSLRGSENLRLLVDGKPSALTGIGGTSALEQLPANIIERVEVITNPSARYDASGMAGIINIVLKKDSRSGLNGSFDLTTGSPQSHSASVNLNFRRQKLNLFLNNSFRYRRNTGGGTFYQEFIDANLKTSLDEDRGHDRSGWSNGLRLGADYFFSNKQILTGTLLYRHGKNNNDATIAYRDFDFSGILASSSTRTDFEDEIEDDLEFTLGYKKKFERKGHEFNFDVKYQDASEEEASDIREEFDFGNNLIPEIQDVSTIDQEKDLLFQADYVHPFAENGKFEAGYKSNFRDINNQFEVNYLDINQNRVNIPELTDDLDYSENVHALYALVGNKLSSFSYQFGLRGELSEINTFLVRTDASNNRSYFDVFPTAHISYHLTPQNSFQLSYSRRIRRPHFRLLFPFGGYTDDRNIRRGNPDLEPEFTNSIELGYLKYGENQSWSSSIYYRHTSGNIERVLTREDTILVFQPFNFSTQHAYGFELTGSYEVGRWLQLDGNFNFFRSMVNGAGAGTEYDSDTYSWFARFTSRMKTWNGLNMQMRLNYRGPRDTVQGTRKALYFIDFGMSRELFSGKGTVAVNVRDLLNTRKWQSEVFGADFYSIREFQWRRRTFTVSFNYRFNQKKRQERQRPENGEGGFDEGEF